ncbi:LysR family transcriptional regulator [Pseudoroseomonas deserti]|uniref:LysR family transcriptional regulator n=1 Tax=Teichococcus deserti TaxID=1817963 RepID=A0A1V2H0T6_9PROT|nr:LysR family transcriptional regulator [Pseudoroseomonas deserti]ONG50281.1 LysR family transcriptional regulator [Pseudoroseomonas deserti]
MAPRNLAELDAFAAIARTRSFRRAAAERGVSVSALSLTMRRLEERMGVRLLHRTTRSVAPTEAGARLLARLQPALDDIAAAVELVNDFRERPTGTVRINAPLPALEAWLAPLAQPFLAANPAVSLELISDAARIDIVEHGFDAGVRFGEDLAQDMVAVPLGGPLRYLVLGTPDYLRRHGVPRHPEEVLGHRCVRHRFPGGGIFPWEFEKGGRKVTITPEGPLTVNDPRVALRAGMDGVGLIRLFEDQAAPVVAAGGLVPVLQDWCPQLPSWFLYYPSRRQMSSAFRTFLEVVAQHRSGLPDTAGAPPRAAG